MAGTKAPHLNRAEVWNFKECQLGNSVRTEGQGPRLHLQSHGLVCVGRVAHRQPGGLLELTRPGRELGEAKVSLQGRVPERRGLQREKESFGEPHGILLEYSAVYR